MQNDEESVTILLAEDDDGHAKLVQERLEGVGVANPVMRFKDGQETWDFLSGTGIANGKAYLLLLDIRMPGLDGVEVLRRVKTDARLKTMPVIMLTTTDDPREISLCYELGCNNYLTKPVEFEKFAEVVKRLGLFLMILRVDKFK
ncbi:MAG: response regulator [Elusimicrobia bacterium]|nr:response regulator [Elusimicrobiota bacterium]